jgi:CheY-like chemotaxis protein
MNDDKRILITDDSEINLEIESAFIENRWGIPCDTAISGEAAVKLCEERFYSLVLMDYLMPVMNGIETAKAIRKSKRNFKTPIVALTGSDDEETTEELIREGFDDVLIKPIVEQSIAEIINKYVGVCFVEVAGNAEHTGAILSDLYNIKGLDATAGLKNVAGNRDSYVKSLRILRDKLPEVNERINNSLLKSDMDRARMYLHSMKSSLSNVGFIDAGKQAAELEKAVLDKDADFYEHHIGAFSDVLEKIARSLEKVFNAQIAQTTFTRVGNEDEFNASLNAILDEFDNFRFLDAKEKAAEMAAVDFGQKKNKAVAELLETLDVFDYEKAANIIKSAIN